MDNSSLRHICFWVTLVSGVAWLCVSTIASAATFGMLRPIGGSVELYADVFGISLGAISLAGLMVGAIHTLSLLILVALLHRDLSTCERWVSFQRSRLASGESGRLAEEPGAGAVGAPHPADQVRRADLR